MTFQDCVKMCAANADFVANVERMTGKTFAFTRVRAPLDFQIDQASGRDDVDMAEFVVLVDELVWSRIPPDPTPDAQPARFGSVL